jgi:ABC-type phosphate transport system auxiliary subunit
MPGKYTVKLTAEGKSYEQPLTIKMDPRIKTSEADLHKQFEMQSGAVQGMNQSYEALRQVQSLRAQLKDRAGKAKGALADSITALDHQAAELEGAAQSAFFGLPSSGKQPENFSTLNQHFNALLTVADSADAAPTTQASAVYVEIEAARGKLIERWKNLESTDLAALNSSLKKAHLQEVDPSQPSVAPPAEDPDGDDVP